MSKAVQNLLNPAMPPPLTEEQLDRQPNLLTSCFDQGDGYQAYRRMGTDTWLIFVTVEGRGFMRGPSGSAAEARPGDVHLYRPNVWHNYGTMPPGRWLFHYAHFQPRANWMEWLQLPPVNDIVGLVHAHVASAHVREQIGTVFDGVHRDSLWGTQLRTEMAMNGIEHILLLVAEASGSGRRALDPRVQSVIQRIASRPGADHSVATLAATVHLSASRFAHLFKVETGQSPVRFVQETRLKEAAKLIELTSAQVSEVARIVGFQSPIHFSSTFRERYGMSPRAYRQRLKSDVEAVTSLRSV
jgi:AraC family transcriptional regulator, arabinose operon regulatory protein